MFVNQKKYALAGPVCSTCVMVLILKQARVKSERADISKRVSPDQESVWINSVKGTGVPNRIGRSFLLFGRVSGGGR